MKFQTLNSQFGRAQSDDSSLRADALRFVLSFISVLVVTETALCLVLDLPNAFTFLASVLN